MADREVQGMISCIQSWPAASDVCAEHTELYRMIRGCKAMVENEATREMMMYILCEHELSGFLRPGIMMLFRSINENVRASVRGRLA